MQTDGQTDMTKLKVGYFNLAKASNKWLANISSRPDASRRLFIAMEIPISLPGN